MSVTYATVIDDLDNADGHVDVFYGEDLKFGVEFLRGRPAARSADIPGEIYRSCIQTFNESVRLERDEESRRRRAESAADDDADRSLPHEPVE